MNNREQVLLTGASGFIGGALAQRLARAGYGVTCLVRDGSPGSIKLKGIEGINIVAVSSFDDNVLAEALDGISATAVINLASYGVKRDERDPGLMIEGNISLLSALMQVTSKWPLKIFVHTGSCSEYAPPVVDTPIREADPLRPASLYGAAKAASFMFGNALATDLGVPMVTLRLFGVYGAGEGPERLLPYLIERLRNNAEVDLTAGEQVRDLLYIDDVTAAFLAIIEKTDLPRGAVYNVCSGQQVRIRDIALSVARAMNKPEKLLLLGEREYRMDEPMWLVGDNTLFRSTTGWRPEISLQDGIERILAALGVEKPSPHSC
ncbi:MAG: NAD(P)-dependent oxidoreductase [Actinobacteria bacterium]|nr:NAD(P)-dependent oxidoreductase [Actinomycetota bacterium]